MAAAFAIALGYLAYALATIPVDGGMQPEGAQSAVTLESATGETFAHRGVYRGEPLAAADLPPLLADAIIAIEDRRFRSHSGVDMRGLARAVWRNARAGGTREGASTITQQLARLMFLSQERSLRRKTQEALLAFWLESQLDKDEILIRYLNTAYFGAGAYGVDAAARRYFGKPAGELALNEVAMLAGLVRAPSQLAPTRNFGGASQRASVVLQAMVETGAVTQAEADAARATPASLRTPPETSPGSNYFVDMVVADVRRLFGAAPGDMALRSTLDTRLQQIAEGVIERRLEAEGAARNASQAALVALRPDGAIVALVGGRDYEESQFNRATQARRQPGSLFKLFVYLAAFEKGFRPETRMVDAPVQIGDWEPQNASRRFAGPVTLREAFARSINTVAAQLADEAGVDTVIDVARRMGVRSPLPAAPSLALGTGEVTLLEMTQAFAAIAAGAASVEPYTIQAISGGARQALSVRPRAQAQPHDEAAWKMTLDVLEAVVAEGTGKAAAIKGVPTAGKTGTSQEHRDAWFVGFAQELIVGVWVGNDDNEPMKGVTGGDLPARIWRDFVSRAQPIVASPRPDASPRPAASARSSVDRPAAAAQAAGPAEGAELEGRAPVRGSARVIDTATLVVGGEKISLAGVEGAGGRLARQLARYLRGQQVACEPAGVRAHRCRLGDHDLAELILAGGGARAAEDAPSGLLAAEEYARSARLGVWRR